MITRVRIKAACLRSWKHSQVSLIRLCRKTLCRHRAQPWQIVNQSIGRVSLGLLRDGVLPGCVEQLKVTHRLGERFASHHLAFKSVCIEFHLPHHETADAMADNHEQPE